MDEKGKAKVTEDHAILIADSGNDQTLVTADWTILSESGRKICMTGPFKGRDRGMVFKVVTAACKLRDELGRTYIGIANECLHDPSPEQKESLLSIHQSLECSDNAIDDRGRSERDVRGGPGTQSAVFGGKTLQFFFDGVKCFFEVLPLEDGDMDRHPHVILTPDTVYEPATRVHTRRIDVTAPDLDRWKENLSFAPTHVIKKTLEATTQMIPVVEAESREIMRDHIQLRLLATRI
jgi:hypothetical protein